MLNLLGDLWFKKPPVKELGSDPNLDNVEPNIEPGWAAVLALPGTHLHLYGKTQARVGRKMGHLNIRGATPEVVRATALRAAEILGIAPF
jgi:5-(carboxyamino)imidazole ribonucleotide synthase